MTQPVYTDMDNNKQCAIVLIAAIILSCLFAAIVYWVLGFTGPRFLVSVVIGGCVGVPLAGIVVDDIVTRCEARKHVVDQPPPLPSTEEPKP